MPAFPQNEDNVDLQTRSAVAVASFIEFCTIHNIAQPPDKIVKNLCTFLCQDVDQTPTFAYNRKHTNGILSFQGSDSNAASKAGKDAGKEKDKPELPLPDDVNKARLSRRGAGLAFNQLSAKFGPRLLDVIPTMWQSMAGGLLSTFQTGMYRRMSFIVSVLTILQILQRIRTHSLRNNLAKTLLILSVFLKLSCPRFMKLYGPNSWRLSL